MEKTYPPGPQGGRFLGVGPELRADIRGFVLKTFQTHGAFTSYSVGPYRIYQVGEPRLIKEVLQDHSEKTVKTWYFNQMRMLIGNGLLLNEGAPWRSQRKKITPAFHHDRIRQYGKTMASLTEEMLAGWADGQKRNLHADMTMLTLRIVYKTLFGLDAKDDLRDHHAVDIFMQRFDALISRTFPIPMSVPTIGNLQARFAARKMHRSVLRHMNERRQEGAKGEDLLSWFVAAQEETGMSEQQIVDEIITLLTAGHETTANTLAWTLMILAKHPDVVQKLRRELSTVLNGAAPQADDVPKLTYTRMVVEESMRLYPPAWLITRKVIEPFELDGYRLDTGSTIYVPVCAVHTDPRWYPDPLEFRPERWATEAAADIPKYAYFPFGGGPRFCIGSGFAMLEAQIILASIVQRFDWTLDSVREIGMQASVTLRPRNGVWATVRPVQEPALKILRQTA
jgi:cytochrome P450